MPDAFYTKGPAAKLVNIPLVPSPILARCVLLPSGMLVLTLSGCGAESGPSQLAPALARESGTTTISAPSGPFELTPLRIMPLGDSITQSDAEHDSYRRPLFHALSQSRPSTAIDFVGGLSTNHRGAPPHPDFDLDHEGHWGFRVDEILERLPEWLEAHRPDVVLVHLGSNDVFQREPIDETMRELSELVETILTARPSATVFVAKIIPTTTPAVNARIDELNARLSRLESDYPGAVRIVDQHAGFSAARMTHDGVHPNEEGEHHMAERWLEALETILP